MVFYIEEMSDSVTLHITNARTIISDFKHGADFRNVLGNSTAGKKPIGFNVRHAVVSHLFSNVYEHNNTLTVGGIEYTVPIGQYDITQILAQLNSMFSATPSVLSFTDAPRSLTNPFDGKIAIQVTSGVVPVTISSNLGGFADVIGVTNDVTITATGGGGEVLTPHQRNLAGPRTLFIHSRRLGHGNAIRGDGRSENIICSIDLTTTEYGGAARKEVHDVYSNLITFDKEDEISGVDIYVTDEHMRRLTLDPNHQIDVVLRAIHSEDTR